MSLSGVNERRRSSSANVRNMQYSSSICIINAQLILWLFQVEAAGSRLGDDDPVTLDNWNLWHIQVYKSLATHYTDVAFEQLIILSFAHLAKKLILNSQLVSSSHFSERIKLHLFVL